MKIFFGHDSRAQNNWGCRATSTALIQLIENAGGEIIGNGSHAPFADFSTTPRIGRALKASIKVRFPQMNRVLADTRDALHGIQGPKRGFLTSFDDFETAAKAVDRGDLWATEAEQVRQADLIIVNGEGSLYGRQLKGFIALFWPWYAKTRLGKLAAIVNQSAELGDPAMRKAAEAVYPILDDVSFREPITEREWNYLAPEGSGGFVPDAAFRYQPLDIEQMRPLVSQRGFFSTWPYDADHFDITKPYVCVVGSSILNRLDGVSYQDSRRSYEVLCSRLAKLDVQVLVAAPDISDEAFLAPVARELGLPFVPACTPIPVAHQLLAHARCLVGGRWHPGILASTGGTPLVMTTANTRKTTALLEILGLDGETFDVRELTARADDVVAETERYLAQGDTVRNAILARVARLREEAVGNVRILERHA